MTKKIIGISGSPKTKNSTTLFALKKALKECEAAGLDTEIIDLSSVNILGCKDCNGCKKKLSCPQEDDFMSKVVPVLKDENVKGIIFATPVYFGGVTSQLKALMDRSVMFRRNGFMFHNVAAGAITVGRSRNGGQELASMDIVKNALIHGMIVVSDAPSTSHFGGNLWSGAEGGIEEDESGILTAVNLGKNMASLVSKL
jgi:multimeric flavodoxin WrbA